MAKKRKQKEEEKERPIFVPPVFDEREFMGNEIKNSKIAFIVFIYGLLFAVLSLFLTRMDQVALALFLGVLGVVIMSRLFDKLKLDTSHLGKKEWVGNFAMFLFAWLGIWIILCNPPFSDFSHPDLDELYITTGYNETWESWNVTTCVLNHYTNKEYIPVWQDLSVSDADRQIHSGELINITLKITDNVGLEDFHMEIDTPNGTETPELSSYVTSRGTYHYVELNYTDVGPYKISIWSKDVNGNENLVNKDWNEKELVFTVWP